MCDKFNRLDKKHLGTPSKWSFIGWVGKVTLVQSLNMTSLYLYQQSFREAGVVLSYVKPGSNPAWSIWYRKTRWRENRDTRVFLHAHRPLVSKKQVAKSCVENMLHIDVRLALTLLTPFWLNTFPFQHNRHTLPAAAEEPSRQQDA